MRVLVTGGAGFIGSHLADALVARGDDVTGVDRLSRGAANPPGAPAPRAAAALAARGDAVPVGDGPSRGAATPPGALARGAAIVRGDVTDAAAMERTFAERRPEIVSPPAAQVDARRSVENPAEDAGVNVGGT